MTIWTYDVLVSFFILNSTIIVIPHFAIPSRERTRWRLDLDGEANKYQPDLAPQMMKDIDTHTSLYFYASMMQVSTPEMRQTVDGYNYLRRELSS
jgi:hypothetical protein